MLDKENGEILQQFTNFTALTELKTEEHEHGYILPVSSDIIKQLNGDVKIKNL